MNIITDNRVYKDERMAHIYFRKRIKQYIPHFTTTLHDKAHFCASETTFTDQQSEISGRDLDDQATTLEKELHQIIFSYILAGSRNCK